MKIVLEEDDLKYIDKVNLDLAEGNCPPLFVNLINHYYYINFTCTDIAKANNFIMELLSPIRETQTNIEETCGIRVNSINYCHGDTKITELKNYLRDIISELDRM